MIFFKLLKIFNLIELMNYIWFIKLYNDMVTIYKECKDIYFQIIKKNFKNF